MHIHVCVGINVWGHVHAEAIGQVQVLFFRHHLPFYFLEVIFLLPARHQGGKGGCLPSTGIKRVCCQSWIFIISIWVYVGVSEVYEWGACSLRHGSRGQKTTLRTSPFLLPCWGSLPCVLLSSYIHHDFSVSSSNFSKLPHKSSEITSKSHLILLFLKVDWCGAHT